MEWGWMEWVMEWGSLYPQIPGTNGFHGFRVEVQTADPTRCTRDVTAGKTQTGLPVHVPVHMSTRTSVHLSVHTSMLYLCIYTSMRLSLYMREDVYGHIYTHVYAHVDVLYACLHVCLLLSIHVSTHMTMSISVHMSIRMSTHMSAHMFIHRCAGCRGSKEDAKAHTHEPSLQEAIVEGLPARGMPSGRRSADPDPKRLGWADCPTQIPSVWDGPIVRPRSLAIGWADRPTQIPSDWDGPIVRPRSQVFGMGRLSDPDP